MSAFESISSLLVKFDDVELLWCPKDCNKTAQKTIKWMLQVIKSGFGYLFEIPPILGNYVLHDLFVVVIIRILSFKQK